MKLQIYLEKSGANLQNYFTDGKIQSLNSKMPSESQFIYKLHPVFSEFSFTERKYHPLPENRKMSTPKIEDIENELKEQSEKQLFQDSNFFTPDCVYDKFEDQKSLLSDPEITKIGQFAGFPQISLKSQKNESLAFESRFENGNLASVYKLSETEYDLYLSPDFQTSKQTFWFFFRIFNTQKNKPYKFNICNFSKSDCTYNEGSKILCFSEKLSKFCYPSQNCVAFLNGTKKRNYQSYSTLSFTLIFPEDNDSVFIMNSLPYTFSRLTSFIASITEHPLMGKYASTCSLTKTLLGFDCPLIIIEDKNTPNAQKRVVTINARQHPGEPLGSYMCERLILTILSETPLGKSLRDRFVFYFCPMLNIDGVVLGNHRLNLAKLDLNRNWKDPAILECPTILAFKSLVASLKSQPSDVFCFLDLHAHSKKYNCFFYSNPLKDKTDHVLVSLLHKNCSFYSINDSTFMIRKEKENSARVVIWKDLDIKLSYTLEAGYGGITLGRFKGEHHSMDSMEDVGLGLALSLNEMWDFETCKETLAKENKNEFLGKGEVETGWEIVVKSTGKNGLLVDPKL